MRSFAQEAIPSETNTSIQADAVHAKRLAQNAKIMQKQRTLSESLKNFPQTNQEALGALVFHGKYAHKDQLKWLGVPTDLWLTQTPEGQLTAISQVTIQNYAIMASGDSENSITRYKIGATETDGLDAYQIEYEFQNGIAIKLVNSETENLSMEGMTFPEGAIFDPNYPSDPFTAANFMLRGLGLEQGADAVGIRAFDIGASGDKTIDYVLTVKHLGKENVAVPAGTFNANHIEIALETAVAGQYPRPAGRVVDFWTLDNGIVIMAQRREENYELQLVEYIAPERLEGVVEDAIATANPLVSDKVVEVYVPAFSKENAGWISSGYSVTAGEEISFRSEGWMQPDYEAPAGGPNGVGPVNDELDVPRLLSRAPAGALIGKIGNTEEPSAVFIIGEESTYLTTQTGVLFFAVNDQFGHFDDNAGGFQTTVVIGALPTITVTADELSSTEVIVLTPGELDIEWSSVVEVPAFVRRGEEWVDTGLSVSNNETLFFQASGKASYHAFNDGRRRYYNADGHVSAGPAKLATPIWGIHLHEDVPVGALVGKIGEQGALFLVGTTKVIRTSEAGKLFLGYNDSYGGNYNNMGSLSARVYSGEPQTDFHKSLSLLSSLVDGVATQ